LPLDLLSSSLKGDFFVEAEILLTGDRYQSYRSAEEDETKYQQFQVVLEGRSGAERVAVRTTCGGTVSINGGPFRGAANFQPNKLARFRLEREGKNYRVSLNDENAVGLPLDYTGSFDTLKLGLAEVPGFQVRAKIYSLKAGLLSAPVHTARSAPLGPGELFKEDFRDTPLGGPPKGWEGDAFSVVKDAQGRQCLEVNKEKGLFAIALPPLALKGDFFVEAEILLTSGKDSGGAEDETKQQQFQMALVGRGGAVRVVVTYTGTASINGGSFRGAANFEPHKLTRFRLEREGKNYRVSLNDEFAIGTPVPNLGSFETVKLALAEVPKCRVRAKIYSVKIGLLNPDNVRRDPVPELGKGNAVREDFSKTKPGELPPGWTASAHGAIMVQALGEERHGLEMNRQAAQVLDLKTKAVGDQVTLPPVSLKEEFYVECEFILPDAESAVIITLKAPRRVLDLGVHGDGKVYLGRDLVDPGEKLNERRKGGGQKYVVRLRRTAAGLSIKMNDKVVKELPPAAAAGEFTRVYLGMAIKKEAAKSPVINSIHVVPVEDKPRGLPPQE